MKNKKPIEERELDQLLNGLFLETNAAAADESAARFIFGQEYDILIPAQKEDELINRLKRKPGDPGNSLNFLMALIVVAVAGIGIYIFSQSEKPQAIQTVKPSNEKQTATTMESQPSSSPVMENKPAIPETISPADDPKEKIQESARLKSEEIEVYYPQSVVGSKSTATFFKPSDRDILFYGKAKNKQLEKLWNFEKELCSLLEEGELQYRGNRLSISPFVLSNHAVTNLEYKIFLTDLIKNGRTEDFKTAVVKSETWINYNDNILATTYFFDPRYNDFPVVNISMKAAELYCEWLEREMNAYSQQVNPSAERMNVRLPYDSEWLYATEKGNLRMSNCSGYNTIYDQKEELVDISYLKRVAQVKKQDKHKHSMLDDLFELNRYGMNENQILQLYEKAFTYTDSVYFSREQLFGKAAHVSEMVVQQQTGKMLVVGSCWKNKQEYSDMLKEFNTVSASPFVGFRVVISRGTKKQNNQTF